MRAAADAVEALEAGGGEAGGDAGELVGDAELGEAAAGEAEVADVLGARRRRRARGPEALDRQVGAPVDADGEVRVALDLVEDLPQQVVRQVLQAAAHGRRSVRGRGRGGGCAVRGRPARMERRGASSLARRRGRGTQRWFAKADGWHSMALKPKGARAGARGVPAGGSYDGKDGPIACVRRHDDPPAHKRGCHWSRGRETRYGRRSSDRKGRCTRTRWWGRGLAGTVKVPARKEDEARPKKGSRSGWALWCVV